MLSILIPIYNFDVTQLVTTLHDQCLACKISFEINLFDDLSKEKFKKINRSLKKLAFVRYNELGANLGRSAIRNSLAGFSRFDNLLFMDCDSKVVRTDFIQKYVKLIDGKSLLYGGRCYQQNAPEEDDLYFHWYYGSQREVQSVERRKENPYHSFMTNNFLIPKKVFLKILFAEQLKQYGHEDTLFGIELKKRNVPIVHFDNPLEHIGLENAKVFLKKSEQAIENLYFLHQNNFPIRSKLLSSYSRLKKFRMLGSIRMMNQKLEPSFLKGINERDIKLRYFDLWKLAKLIEQFEK